MRAYERLIRYAKVYTTSDESFDCCPSTARQLDLANMLADELKALGITDARVDKNGYVYGSLPATAGYEGKPVIGFIAHMDTAPDACGENVKPMIHENYNGKDLTLPGGVVLSVEKFPFLKSMAGETLITSDGTTLLGADDKAGIAEIVTLAEELLHSDLPHGKICFGFTPDEEIGRGADEFDVDGFAADYAYTVDGGELGGVEYETFNAAAATVTVKGLSIHPGAAKNKMINAAQVAMEFHAMLPVHERPESTENYEGFCMLNDIRGGIEETVMRYIIRDHDREKFEEKKDRFYQIAVYLDSIYGDGTVEVETNDSYYNMREKIEPVMYVVDRAKAAMERLGIKPYSVPVRGGTDGARLSFMGLPCPNLCTGGMNFHGRYEYAVVEEMESCARILVEILTDPGLSK